MVDPFSIRRQQPPNEPVWQAEIILEQALTALVAGAWFKPA
jgi:hypothetical protein